MGIQLSNPETWKGLWMDALNSPTRQRRRAEAPESIERWNKRAQQFAENAVSPSSQDRQNELLDWLQQSGALKKGFKVLDIGAGSGRYAIPMAQMGCEVVALEPAEAMVEHIRERMNKESLSNIEIINKPWQEVDLDKDNLRKQFDLVFASMTPGIQAPDDLLNMIGASRCACYLSSHTKNRWYHMEMVWKEIFGQVMPVNPGDFIYRLGFVYALGYVPLTFHQKGSSAKRGMKQSPEKLKEDILWSLSSYIDENDFTEDKKLMIDEYVNAIDMGKEEETARNMSSQAMLWFINK